MYIDTINMGNGTQSYAVSITSEPYQILLTQTTLQGVLSYINASCNTTGLKAVRRSKNTWIINKTPQGYQYNIRKVT